MSMISDQIKEIRECEKHIVDTYGNPNDQIALLLRNAADTIEKLSTKLAGENMERSTAHYNDGWISCSEKTPEFEIYTLTPMWVTLRKKDRTYFFVTHLKWNGYQGRWEWNNGKTVSDLWEVIAWKKIEYPAPYQPKGEQAWNLR